MVVFIKVLIATFFSNPTLFFSLTGNDSSEENGAKPSISKKDSNKNVVEKSRERTKKVINDSREKTKRAFDKSREKTKRTFEHGKEDITIAADIIKTDFSYKTYKTEADKRAFFIRAAKLFGPPALLISWYAFLLWTPFCSSSTQLVMFSALYLLPSPFGKETMIPTSVSAGAEGIFVALTFTIVDAFLVMFVAWNFDYIMRVPNIGKYAKTLETAARTFLDKPNFVNRAIKQLATIGIFFFVMLPFQGGGGANGAIIGRVMGLRAERIIIAVTLGTVVESFALTYASDWFLGLIPSWAGCVGYIIFIGAIIIYLISARRKKLKKNNAQQLE